MLTQSESDIVTECRGMPRSAAGKSMGKDGRNAARVTATLSKASKAEVDRLAAREGVSSAWVVRRAVDLYIKQAGAGPSGLSGRGSDAQR